jgi:GMP synthase (glutamine-hydrolysing)
LLGLSGGVDSSVVAALLHRAIGDQLTCVFVDNGLLRHHEGDQVMQVFARNLGVKVIRSMPRRVFWMPSPASPTPRPSARSSAGCSSRCSTSRPRSIEGVDFLAQGTIYPT